MTCVCADDKLLSVKHLYANTPEKVVKQLIHYSAVHSSKKEGT